MEPLITNRLDPVLLRVAEKQSGDRENPPRRRRPANSEKAPSHEQALEATEHKIDDHV